MSNLRTEQPVFETDRITDGFDIFFWVFNDASSFVATHWHTAIEIMYIIDGEIDVMMNQQTVILKPGDVFLIDSRLPHSTKSVHGNHAVLIQLPYEFSKKYIPDVDSFIFGFDCHTDNAILRTKIDSLIDVIQKMRIVYEIQPKGALLRFNSLLFEMLYLLYHSFSREVESSQFKKDVKNFVRLEPVLEYTKKHYNTPITLSEISQIACFQEEYFCHYFKKNMGVTYFQYLNEIRLSHIYRDFTSTDLLLKVLLEKHGFTNYKLFRKMFYEQFATTPGEYRKNAAVSD